MHTLVVQYTCCFVSRSLIDRRREVSIRLSLLQSLGNSGCVATLSAIFISAGVDDRRWDLNFENVLERSNGRRTRDLFTIVFWVADSRAYGHDENDGFGLMIGTA